MLEHKAIDHRVVDLFPGMHPILLRLAGFRGGTVPALRLDGRRFQGSLVISRALDQLCPEPTLFPPEDGRRRAVEEAEAWGERELQSVARRIFRWALSRDPQLRRWMASEIVRVPAPGMAAAVNAPVARAFARQSGASEAQVRADVAALPAYLDRVDELIAEGTVGTSEPNAADFQIGTTVRLLLALEDLRPLVEGRPAAGLAMRLLPSFPGPIPLVVPSQWLAVPPRRGRSGGEAQAQRSER
jgi:glutathione S-transferase